MKKLPVTNKENWKCNSHKYSMYINTIDREMITKFYKKNYEINPVLSEHTIHQYSQQMWIPEGIMIIWDGNPFEI